MAVAALEAGCVCEAGIHGLRSLRRRHLYALYPKSYRLNPVQTPEIIL